VCADQLPFAAHPCEGSTRHRRERDCVESSFLRRRMALYGRDETPLLDPLVPTSSIRSGSRPAELPRAADAPAPPSYSRSSTSQPLGSHPEQRENFAQLHQAFGLASLSRSQWASLILFVEQRLEPLLNTFGKAKTSQVTWHLHFNLDRVRHCQQPKLLSRRDIVHHFQMRGRRTSAGIVSESEPDMALPFTDNRPNG
jgi:hypothetical protein